MKIETGGPAFPRAAHRDPQKSFDDNLSHDQQEGMTLRDYFASHAPKAPEIWMNKSAHQDPLFPQREGLVFCQECKDGCDCTTPKECGKLHEVLKAQEEFTILFHAKRLAAWNLFYADAMLKERSK